MGRSGWLILAVAANAIVASLSQAQTNSCISSTGGFWDEARLWSLATPPSLAQSAVLITNAAAETVTIDSTTAHHFKSTMTISNLNISTDTISLDNAGATALHILNSLTIGITFNNFGDEFSIGGKLITTNSTVVVDGLSGGQIQDNGTIVIAGGSLIATNCGFQLAVSADNTSSGFLGISNGFLNVRDVSVGSASSSGSGGLVEVIGGTMTVSSSLTLGFATGGGGAYGTLLVANGGWVVVTNAGTGIYSGSVMVSNATFLGAGMSLATFHSGGELVIDSGTVNLSGGLNIAVGDVSDGSVTLNGGMLVVTNGIINAGGETSNGQLNILDGVFLGQQIFLLGGGKFSIQGGTSILSSNLGLGFGGTFFVSGGQLFVTNASIFIDGGLQSQSVVSGGLLAASYIEVGGSCCSGQLSANGGSVTASTGITVGNCASDSVSYFTVNGGQVIVTNAAHTGFIDAANGQLALSNGVLRVDKLVMTNSCSSFVHTGGTLIAGSVVLDPNAFAITSIAREGDDLRITWLMGPGQTNALQVSSGGKHGTYTGKGFADIFVVTNNTTAGTLTNYLDIGAATNKPSRYYRARLAP
jgi:hypothetical protein